MKIRFFAILVILATYSCVPATNSPLVTNAVTSERVEFSMLSPDETKTVQTKDWLTFEILERRTDKKLWTFTYNREKFGKGNELPEAGYIPFYWSKDGKYIYVFAKQGWDGGHRYYGDVFGAEEGIARFDVDAGMMTEILPEFYGSGYTFSISRDEQSIVYADQREAPLVLRWKSLTNDDERIIWKLDENVFDVGEFGWSPQMDKLIFETVTVQNPFESNQEFMYSLFVIDLENPQPQIIIEGLEERLSFESWNNQEKVFFTDFENITWQLDLKTKEIRALETAPQSP
jgi:hypothetical protein